MLTGFVTAIKPCILLLEAPHQNVRLCSVCKIPTTNTILYTQNPVSMNIIKFWLSTTILITDCTHFIYKLWFKNENFVINRNVTQDDSSMLMKTCVEYKYAESNFPDIGHRAYRAARPRPKESNPGKAAMLLSLSLLTQRSKIKPW